jgi:ribosomal protein S18 acetylase RimI-like enzyme
MTIEYRMLDLHSTADIQQWRDLYNISFNKSIPENQWRWKYIHNPSGNDVRSPIYLAIFNNLIIGSLSLLPMQLYFHSLHENEMESAGLMTNVMVSPDFRNRGVFSKLLTQAMDDAVKEGLKVLYCYTINNFSSKGFLRKDWREVKDYKSYSLYLNPQQTVHNFLKTAHHLAPLKPILSLIPSKPIMLKRYKNENCQFQFSCGNVEDLLFDIEKIHTTNPAENRISGVRNLQTLKWFFGYPDLKYFCFCMREGEELLAYIIIRQMESNTDPPQKTASIEDSYSKYGDNPLENRLLFYMIEQLRKYNFTKISTYFFRKGLAASFPLYNGFIRRNDETRFLYYPVGGNGLSEKFWTRIRWDIQQAERTPV